MSADHWAARVVYELGQAHYPTPQVVQSDRYTALVWGWKMPGGIPQPQITVFDDGTAVIAIDRHPDAVVRVRHIAVWLQVLHPHIADVVAHTMMADPIPVPTTPLPWGALPAFAYLHDTTDGVYATFADRSRLWVSSADGLAALDALLGTVTGYQLGITTATAVAVATRTGIMYLDPVLAEPTSTVSVHGYQPALAISDSIVELPHPPSTHLVTPDAATTIAARRLSTTVTTQAANGHIYRNH